MEGLIGGPSNVGEKSTAKNYCPVSLLSEASKVFEKLVDNRILDHLEIFGFFLISSMVLGLLDQLQIFWELCLKKLLGLSTGLGPPKLIYPRLDITKAFFKVLLVFFSNLRFMKFQVRYLALLYLFSVIDGFAYFWMGNVHKNIQLIQEPLKALFLGQHISYYALTTFKMMLSVILLMIPMLMILLCTVSLIRHLICGSK